MIGLYIGITDLVGDIFIRFDQVNAIVQAIQHEPKVQGTLTRCCIGPQQAETIAGDLGGIVVKREAVPGHRISQGGGVGHVPSGQIDRVREGVIQFDPGVELTLLVGDGRQVDRLHFIDQYIDRRKVPVRSSGRRTGKGDQYRITIRATTIRFVGCK